MAGLNDDVDEGLDTYITPPDENPEVVSAPAVTLVTKTGKADKNDNCPNNVKPSDLFGGPIVPGELPNFDAEFIIVTDTKNRIADNRSLKSSIDKSCSICKEDALIADELVPGFLNEDKPIGFFTDKKSKVQLNETMSALDIQLEKDIETLKNAIESSTASMIERFRVSFKHMEVCLSKALTNYQPVLAKMVLLVDGKPDEKNELTELLDIFSNTNLFVQDILVEKYPQLTEAAKCMMLPSFKRNLDAVVSLIDRMPGQAKVFHFDSVDYTTQDTEPFLAVREGRLDCSHSSLLKVLYNGLDKYSIEHFNALCQVANNTTNAMEKSLELVKELNQGDKNSKDKLDFLNQIASVSNKYARQNISILSFTRDYFSLLDNLFGLVMGIGSPTAGPMINLTDPTH